MELDELVRDIPRFDQWAHPAKIRLFGWFLHVHRSIDRFSVSDVRGCYESLSIGRPGNMSQTFADMAQKSPPELLRDGRGWYLERKVRDGLDTKYGERAATVQVHKLLQELPRRLADTAERAYLDEALICFKHGANRAAIVMCWNVTYDHLREYVLQHRLAEFNAAIPRRYQKETMRVSSRDDFTEWNESRVIEVCRTADIISKNVYQVLSEKLTKRNHAAHPSGLTFDEVQTEAYILDVIKNGLLKIGTA